MDSIAWLGWGLLIFISGFWLARQNQNMFGRRAVSANAPMTGAESVAPQVNANAVSLLLQLSTDVVICFDQQGQITEANQIATRLLGPLRGRNIASLVDAHTQQVVRQYSAQSGRQNPLHLDDVSITAADLSTVKAQMQLAQYDADGSNSYLLQIREQSLALHYQSRLTVLDSIKDALLQSNLSSIVVIDSHDRIVEFNPSAERLFGFSRGQVIGRMMGELLVPPALRQRHYLGIERFLTTGVTTVMRKRIEVSALNAAGLEFPIELEISPVQLQQGWLFMAVMNDISERKQSTAKIESALQQAEQANQAQSRFLTSVSHEIRTPLHAILGLIECLQHTALNDQQLHYVNTAQIASENLLNMVNDILDLARIEAGKRETHFSVFNPRLLLEEHLEIYQHRITEKGLSLYLTESAQVPRLIRSDITILRQILTNLLSNACKYTEQGAIVVRSSVQAATSSQGAFWCIDIKDSGPGLTKEQIDRLFQEFTRFHSDETSSGTGVGLMISQQLTQLIGGSLTVSSEVGAGSVFQLALPIEHLASPRRFRQLLSLHVYLLGAQTCWFECLTEQLRAIGVGAVTAITLADVSDLPSGAIVLIDNEVMDSAGDAVLQCCEHAADLRVISTGTDLSAVWAAHPQHYAFVSQPYVKADLIRALRAARRKIILRWTLTSRVPQPLLLVPPTSHQAFHVLLVDDSEVNRLTIRTFLGLEGIRVTEAVNGAEAVSQVEAGRFDLILMDMRMPVLGGLQATQQIRQRHLADHTPIIALTAHVQEQEKHQCLAAGMQDFLTKPIGKAMLLKRVMFWLNQQQNEPEDDIGKAPTVQSDFEQSLLLDPELLGQLAAELPADTVKNLVQVFVQEVPKLIREAMDFLEQKQFERVEILVHSLKSSAQTFGASRLSNVAKAAEMACRDQNYVLAAQYCALLPALGELTVTTFLAELP